MSVSDIERSERISPRVITNNYPYTSSIASSAASSSSSVFSTDNHSSQSSAPSSSKSSLHAGWESEHSDSLAVTDYQVAPVDSASQNVEVSASQHVARVTEHAVAPELRQHPRRTSIHVDATNGCALARPPPSLVRQCDRKDNFVESLVGKLNFITHSLTQGLCVTTLEDTTTQMIEVIWPLSVIPCGRDAVLGGKNLIGLRTFIQEVLKRSKTSYSTLQVALYYLILIKPHIPTVNFCMEQSEDSHTARAMQCGRRMFLASLILASKYLQDRNYSARAWSKISGLKISEINSNEMAFVTAIDWRLHVSEPLFQRWTDVVLKFNPPASSSSPTVANGVSSWRSVIPKLTPQLDNLDGMDVTRLSLRDSVSPAIGHPLNPKSGKLSMSPPAQLSRRSSLCSSSNQATPTPSNPKPMAIEPTIRDLIENRPRFPPISPKITLLPTPQLTPQSANFSTPAVSASGFCPAKSAMSYAWKQVQRNCLARTTLDIWPSVTCPDTGRAYPTPSRSSSLVRTASSISSPESMVSDVSARSSRSSSISSVASSACALPQPSLAVQATRRCANMQLSCIKENCPAVIRSSPELNPTWEGRLTSSPLSYTIGPKESYIRDCKAAPQPRPSVPEFSDHDAAEGLRDLALNRHARTLPPLITNATVPRKRERPSSISDSTLQETVRGLLQPRSLYFENCAGSRVDEDDGTVLVDNKIADSFTLRPDFTLPQLSTLSNVNDPSGNARKRACYVEHHSRGMGIGSENLAMAMPATGPGMWTGVL
ncbi:hypothetical protein MMC30_004311 [Trapelia coarctata]|nr:hypothetical protein [Trapelia coarctata]